MFGFVTSSKGTPTRTNVSVTTAAKVASANGNRKCIIFQNTGANTVFLGGSDVTNSGASRGYSLFAGATFTDTATAGEWWAVSSTGTNILHVIEVA